MKPVFLRVLVVSFVLTALAVAGTGCVSPLARRRPIIFKEEELQVEREPDQLLMNLTALRSRGPGTHSLGPGDFLVINVLNPSAEETRYKYELRVSPTGHIMVPQLGELYVDGMPVSALEAKLTSDFKKYIRSPYVTVIPTYATRNLMVMGAVGRAGPYEVPRFRSTVLDALVEAGGLRDTAGDKLIVIRAGAADPTSNPDGEAQLRVLEMDLDRLCSGDTSLNLELNDGDIVIVPPGPRHHLYIQGHVRNPKRYDVDRDEQVSVMQAIAMAGGLTFQASKRHTYVVRHFGTEAEESTRIHLGKIAAGKQPDILLNPGDSLIMESSLARQFLYYLRGILTLGVGYSYAL